MTVLYANLCYNEAFYMDCIVHFVIIDYSVSIQLVHIYFPRPEHVLFQKHSNNYIIDSVLQLVPSFFFCFNILHANHTKQISKGIKHTLCV